MRGIILVCVRLRLLIELIDLTGGRGGILTVLCWRIISGNTCVAGRWIVRICMCGMRGLIRIGRLTLLVMGHSDRFSAKRMNKE